MEWIVLFILAPLLLVPVVMLWGYAGCGFNIQGHAPTPPGTPENLTVTGTTPNSVSLSWTHESQEDENSNVSFEVSRRREGQVAKEEEEPASSTTFTVADLYPSILYHFKVKAVSGMYESGYSAEVSASTLPPAPCFNAALTTDDGGREGCCIVQRIEPVLLAAGGSKVFITIRGSAVGDLLVDSLFISKVGPSGNPYDSAGDNKAVALGLHVPANTSVRVGPVAYKLDPTVPLLVSFDINGTAGNGNVRYVPGVPASQATMYFRAATAEAQLHDRSPTVPNPGLPPYSSFNRIYLIETIEVA